MDTPKLPHPLFACRSCRRSAQGVGKCPRHVCGGTTERTLEAQRWVECGNCEGQGCKSCVIGFSHYDWPLGVD